MNWDLAFTIGAVLFVVLNVFDVLTTFRFLKDGTGYEANPIMAWVQSKLGKNWWIVKIPFLAIPILMYIKARGLPGTVGIWIACAGYGLIVWNNYRLSK